MAALAKRVRTDDAENPVKARRTKALRSGLLLAVGAPALFAEHAPGHRH